MLRPLDGEAPSGAFSFNASHGPLPNAVGHTFPILAGAHSGRWELIGTGFHVSPDGMFVTAKHVIEQVLATERPRAWDPLRPFRSRQARPIAILQFAGHGGLFGGDQFIVRPIEQCWFHNDSNADIAFGIAKALRNKVTGELLQTWHWNLDWDLPPLASETKTYAFPNHELAEVNGQQVFTFAPAFYPGRVISTDVSRYGGHTTVHTSARLHGAASGGPLIGSSGRVVGVNRSEEIPGVAVAQHIRTIAAAVLELQTPDGPAERVNFGTMATTGRIGVIGYTAQPGESEAGYRVRLDDVPVENLPKIAVRMQLAT